MSVETWALIGGFCGSMFGITGGFLGVEVIKFLVSLRDRPHPHAAIMEWATAQPGVEVLHEQQIANFWVRTYDTFGRIDSLEGDPGPIALPCRYVSVAIGGAGDLPTLMANSPQEAEANHARLVNQVRRTLRIIPK